MATQTKTLVLCFDGTSDEFGQMNSNVIKLFSILRKDDEIRQRCYYQTGIGTYTNPGIVSPILRSIATTVDMAVAWYLDHHVMQGYQFLIQNYWEGDRICLFGFSRGAYTARALAAMLYSVGLLTRDNLEQIPFAYKVYAKSGPKAAKQAAKFKDTFSRPVTVEFLGCWDTVVSTGVIYSRTLPFTSSNTIIKTFRHALSLDEHRTKFLPNVWHRPAPNEQAAFHDPQHGSSVEGKTSPPWKLCPLPGEDPVIAERAPTDVQEVWFSGCHSDIGGGNQLDNDQVTLSNITLRWMVREICSAQPGILFDLDMMCQMGFPKDILARATPSNSYNSNAPESTSTLDAQASVSLLTDELQKKPLWWILEPIPFPCSWQSNQGIWKHKWRANLGRGREIYTASPNFHVSVKDRMADNKLNYRPRAKFSGEPNWID